MLWIFETGKMAKKFGRWRGAVTVAVGVCVCLLAVALSNLAGVLHNLETAPSDASTLALAAMMVYCGGILLGIWGAYLFAIDATRGAYIEAAEKYDRERA